MSTTIYTGFKFKTDDIYEAMKDINEFRKHVKEVVDLKREFYFANEMQVLFDAVTAEKRSLKKGDSVYGVVASNFYEKYRNSRANEYSRDDTVDYETSIVIFPFEEKLYGMVFSALRELTSDWFAQDFIEDYHYQNQSDMPEDVTEEDWSERARVWEGILEISSIPSNAGMTVQLVEGMPLLPQMDKVIKHFDSFERRCERMAENVLFEEKNKKISPDKMISAYMDFQKWLKTPDGKLELAKKTGYMEQKLKKEITQDDLLDAK